jgi:arginine decarboxylase
MYVPTAVFPTSGVGRHETRIGSFEMALRDAGIAPYNLVPVSSIVPPDAGVVDPAEGVASLEEGQVVHAVLARADTDGEGGVAGGVGVATASEQHGYAVEQTGRDGDAVGDTAETLARDLLASEPEDSFAVTASATGDGDRWTTAVASLVYVP